MSSKTTTTTTEPPLAWAYMFRIEQLRCGHRVLVARVQEEEAVCPVCYAEARATAGSGAADVAIMVRHLTGVERDRAIGRMDGYVLRHLAHAARSHSQQSFSVEHDLTDTQKLEAIR